MLKSFVAPKTVVGRRAVQPRDGACKYREAFARVVAYDTNLPPQLRGFGRQRQACGGNVPKAGRVVAQEAEIMNGIRVYALQFNFLLVREQGLAADRPGRHDVAVGQDDAALRVHHEPGAVQECVGLGIERTGLVDPQGHHRRADLLQGFPPGRLVVLGLKAKAEQRQRRRRCRQGRSHSHSSV